MSEIGNNSPFLPPADGPGTAENTGSPPGRSKGKKITRRRFLKWTGLLAGAAAAGSVIDAFAVEPHWFKVRPICLPVANLPPAWQDVRIVQISDIHVGKLSSLDHARRIVDMTNDLNPEIVVLTGDYVSRADAVCRALVEVLRDLRARKKFAVLGNHDYWTDAPGMIASLEGAGIAMLTNRHHIVHHKGQPLCFAGVDDLWAGRPDAARALAGAPENVPRILLCHNPDFAEQIPYGVRIDLMLSGHTHGGQFRLPFIGALRLPIRHRKYAEGLVAGPKCPVFITRGLGMVGVPVRFNCRPELPLITLRRV